MGIDLVAKACFLTKGVGVHREKLSSFEIALRDASIAEYNLVRVSSIFPPYCKLISKKEGKKMLHPGQVVFSVISDSATNEPHRLIAASVGLAIPSDSGRYGYLSEHHAYGQTEKFAGDYAEDLAAEMLATTLGVDFDASESYDKRREIWRISGQIVSTKNITQTAIGHKNGMWTTVVTACILIT